MCWCLSIIVYGVYSRTNFSDSNQTEMKTEILESISEGEVL